MLNHTQPALLVHDAPPGLVFGSLEWADLQSGCGAARIFDLDPATFDHDTLTGLSVAIDEGVREEKIDVEWFEFQADVAVIFSAAQNDSAVLEALADEMPDIAALEQAALTVLDTHRLNRYQRAHDAWVHLEALSNATAQPMPMRREIGRQLLLDLELEPDRAPRAALR